MESLGRGARLVVVRGKAWCMLRERSTVVGIWACVNGGIEAGFSV